MRWAYLPVSVIYGYASTFAFAGTAGLFSTEHLLSLTFNNALIAILFSIVVGTTAGYLNALLVGALCGLKWNKGSGMAGYRQVTTSVVRVAVDGDGNMPPPPGLVYSRVRMVRE